MASKINYNLQHVRREGVAKSRSAPLGREPPVTRTGVRRCGSIRGKKTTLVLAKPNPKNG